MPFSAILRMASITAASGPIAWTSGPLGSSSCLTVRMAAPLLGHGWRTRAYPFTGAPDIDEVVRPLLRFLVQPAEVLADEPERDQLHAAQEQDHRHPRRPARHRVAPEQRLEDDPEAVTEGEHGRGHAQVGRQAQGRGREAGDALEGEVPQPP